MPSAMRVRVVRSLRTKSVLDIATSITAVAADLADATQFTPLRAAASILLGILETVQAVESNRDQCFLLARKATKLLLDLQRQMEGKWDTAPASLIYNVQEFEKILLEISKYMEHLMKAKWVARVLQKSSIESDLSEYSSMLDDAQRSFQIVSLIEIHHTVNLIQVQRSMSTDSAIQQAAVITEVQEPLSPAESLPQYESPVATVFAGSVAQVSTSIIVTEKETADDSDEESIDLNSGGFKRYHRSEVRLKKKLRHDKGFWSYTSVADIGGQKALVKHYEGPEKHAAKEWIKDIKTLKNLYHPNLPQMIGYSDDGDATHPFVVMAHAQLQDIKNVMWKKFQTDSIASCVTHILKNYRDIASAALYVQRQLSLEESQIQDFIADASYALDNDNNVIVGLPPPRSGKWTTARSYRLTGSLIDRSLSVLPDPSILSMERTINGPSPLNQNEQHRKFAHLQRLLHTLLPERGDHLPVIYTDRGLDPNLPPSVEDLLEGEDEELSLGELRKVAIAAGRHTFTWHEAVSNCEVKFEPGDIGFISGEGLGFHGFVRLANIFDLSCESGKKPAISRYDLSIVKETLGTQSSWLSGFRDNHESWPFVLPNDLEGWVVALNVGDEITLYIEHRARLDSVNEAWRYLLNEAPALAINHSVDPQDLVMVTQTNNATNYTLHHLEQPQHFGHGLKHTSGFNPGNRLGNLSSRPQPPTLVYLFTSNDPNFRPYWNARPTPVAPGSALPNLRYPVTENRGRHEVYINYIKLTKEDFEACI